MREESFPDLPDPPIDELFEDYLSSLSSDAFSIPSRECSLAHSGPLSWLPEASQSVPNRPIIDQQYQPGNIQDFRPERHSSDSQYAENQIWDDQYPKPSSPFNGFPPVITTGLTQSNPPNLMNGQNLHMKSSFPESLDFSPMTSMELANVLNFSQPLSAAPSLEPHNINGTDSLHQGGAIPTNPFSGPDGNGDFTNGVFGPFSPQDSRNINLEFPSNTTYQGAEPNIQGWYPTPQNNFSCDLQNGHNHPEGFFQPDSGSSPESSMRWSMMQNSAPNGLNYIENQDMLRTTSVSGKSAHSDILQGGIEGTEQEDIDERGIKGKSAANKSRRQQELNKLAQQRYRQKKRQIAEDTEKAAEILAERAEEYRQMSQNCEKISERNSTLKQTIADRIAELERLKLQNQTSEDKARHSEDQKSKGQEQSENKVINQEFEAVKNELQSLLNSRESGTLVKNASINSGRDPEMELLIKRALKIAYKAGSALAQSSTGSKASKGNSVSDQIDDLVLKLTLTVPQIKVFCRTRKTYAEKLKKLLDERPGLNFNLMKSVLSQGATGSSFGQNQSSSFQTLFARAKNGAQVQDTVQALKENLRAEHRIYTEMEYITFHRILSAMQAAKVILSGYAVTFNVMDLSNAVTNRFQNMQ